MDSSFEAKLGQVAESLDVIDDGHVLAIFFDRSRAVYVHHVIQSGFAMFDIRKGLPASGLRTLIGSS